MVLKEKSFPFQENENNNIEIERSEENQEQEVDIYRKAREEADVFLKNIEFIKKEEIIEVIPEEIKEETPVFVSPGWGVSLELQKQSLKTISLEGRIALTACFEREEKIKEGEEGDIPIAELQKALTIVSALEKMGEGRFDAIGHSEGGLNLAIAASLYPEKFRNLVFISPAGMIGKDSYMDLIKRFAIDEGIKEFKNMEKSNIDSFYKYFKGILKYVFKNPLLAHKEIKEISQMDIFKMTKYLKDRGVGVGFVCGADDKVFPIEEVIKNVNKQNLDHFISTTGDHGAFIFDDKHILLATDLLKNMDKKDEQN
ncbi:MAG: alpha/beta fold hydrolase [Candidatus Paceibacterota bacterium]|jgi:hypothetical protein